MPRNHNPSFRPRLEHLEDREVPAVTAVLNGGILLLQGTPQADFVRVSVTNNLLLVTQAGISPLRVFNRANVSQILFFGGGGNDVFVNDSPVPSMAFGGPGNDLLVSLASQSQMVGGRGNDLIVGGLGVQMLGGAGVNGIFQTTGLNPFTVFTNPSTVGLTAADLALLSQNVNAGFNNLFALVNPATPLTGTFNPINPFNTGFNNALSPFNVFNTGFDPISAGFTTFNTGFTTLTPGFTTVNTGFNTFTAFNPVTITPGPGVNGMPF
jgi:hypothetical protein